MPYAVGKTENDPRQNEQRVADQEYPFRSIHTFPFTADDAPKGTDDQRQSQKHSPTDDRPQFTHDGGDGLGEGVGVGLGVNTHLLDRLSGQNGGQSTYVEPGEDIEHALKREIWEETNLECTVDRFVAILQYEDASERASFRTHLFLVREIAGVLRSNDPTEHITEWCEVAPSELLNYARVLAGMNSDWSNWGLFRAAALETLAGYCDNASL